VQVRPEPRSSLANLVARGADLDALAPGEGQVLVNVKAVGVNFRDVLNVLGGWPCWLGGWGQAEVVARTGALLMHPAPADPGLLLQACTPATPATPAATAPAW
jgi:hypothetical protein